MNDYEKLKLAHEPCSKLDEHYFGIDYCVQRGTDQIDIELFHTDLDRAYHTHNIDDLTTKLRELMEPEPKYKVGDEVWYIDLPVNEIHYAKILKVGDGEYIVNGRLNDTKDDFTEAELYPTKAQLIEAQIEYWSNLKIESMSNSTKCPKCGMKRVSDGMCWVIGCDYKKCEHEPEMNFAKDKRPRYEKSSNPKCIKCGEFYR